ncbi:hypothetical protein J4Q44_G00195600 [Coregonus suidteri]|uniref:Uncharacterized protein n=1 Tax=Coregonus suidteri TaxID=861788 RepID=A0AAN8QLG7_9TELE
MVIAVSRQAFWVESTANDESGSKSFETVCSDRTQHGAAYDRAELISGVRGPRHLYAYALLNGDYLLVMRGRREIWI